VALTSRQQVFNADIVIPRHLCLRKFFCPTDATHRRELADKYNALMPSHSNPRLRLLTRRIRKAKTIFLRLTILAQSTNPLMSPHLRNSFRQRVNATHSSWRLRSRTSESPGDSRKPPPASSPATTQSILSGTKSGNTRKLKPRDSMTSTWSISRTSKRKWLRQTAITLIAVTPISTMPY
jgi:hypothetical protein